MSKLNIAIVPVTEFQQNCTLMWNEDDNRGVVIDPGGDVQQIEAAIAETGMHAETILLTHGHLDHVGGAQELKDRLNARIVGPHLNDKELCEGVEKIAEAYGLGGQFNSVTPDQWLSEGDTVAIGGYDFDVYHCPGHSPGHVIFHSPELKFAHVGDVLFHRSIGRTDLPGGNHDQLISSIKTKLLPLGDEVGFVCGHGPGGTLGDERANNPFLQ